MASTPPTKPGSFSLKPTSKPGSMRMPDPQAPAPIPEPPKKTIKWVWFVPVAMMGIGYVVGGFFVRATPKPDHAGHHAEEHHTDPTIDDTMAEQRWKDALGKIGVSLKTAAGPENAALRFREAICLERLGQHRESAKSFAEVITAEPTTVRGTAARIGWARCQIKLDRLPEARAALCRLVLISGADGKTSSPLHADLLATLAHVEYHSGGHSSTPYPLDPLHPAGTEKIPDLEQLIVWAGPLRHAHAGKHHHAGHDGASHGDAHHEDNHADAHQEIPHGDAHLQSHGGGWWHQALTLAGKDAHAPKHDDHPKKPDSPGHDAHDEMHDAHEKKQDAHELHEKKPGPAKEPARPVSGEIRIARGAKPGEWLVTTDMQSRGLQTVVETLARELGLSLKLTGDSEEHLSGRAANIAVQDLPTALLLDALLLPAELEWTIKDLDLVISPITENEAAWRARTKTALNRALAAGPEHAWRTGLMIDLGNLEFLAKNWKGASETYIRALDEGGLRPEAIAANHNLGLACVHLGLRDRAREQFQNLADRDTSGRWGSLAYWWAGRTHLDVDEPEKAAKFFETAVATGETGPAVTASALGLAFCHLLRNDYASALAALRPHKEALKTPEFKSTAAYADALCRFKLAENPKGTGEADEILYAVLNAGEQSAVGPAGVYLLGKTCRELGFGPRMAVMYARTVETLRGALAVRMTRELADYQYSVGDTAKAAEGYKAVAAINRGEPGRHAWLQLARLSLRSNQADDAARYCVEAMRVGADKTAILNELGRAYEIKKDYKRAAKCFGGEFP